MEKNTNLIAAPVYQDILNDIIFKRFFGRRENKHLLISMLNLIIKDFSIVDLEYLSPEFTGFDRTSKNSRMDLLVRTDNGAEINVEVQVRPQQDFKNRALYYSTLPILQEINSGDQDYHLSPRYVISFLHFRLKHDANDYWQNEMESRYEMLERFTYEKFSDVLNLIFVELGRFNKKSLQDIDNDKERLYFCLLHMSEFSAMPEELKGIDFFERLFKAAEFEALSKEDKDKYLRLMTTERDIRNQDRYAHNMAFAEGKAEGKAEGINEVIVSLLQSGMSVSEISRITKIPEEQIASLK